MVGLTGSLVLVAWPQLLVGGGGIALVAVGVIFGVAVVRHVRWRRERPTAIAYAVVMVLGAVVGGACFIAAASLRSHFWELTGSIIIVASYAAREVLARLGWPSNASSLGGPNMCAYGRTNSATAIDSSSEGCVARAT
jgi:uncharacterized membrane protein YfcA